MKKTCIPNLTCENKNHSIKLKLVRTQVKLIVPISLGRRVMEAHEQRTAFLNSFFSLNIQQTFHVHPICWKIKLKIYRVEQQRWHKQ